MAFIKRLLDLRVNGWIFLAFTWLFIAVMSIAALLSTLDIIGICYSSFVCVEDDRTAVYSYIVGERSYTYSVPAENTSELLLPRTETVFYFKEYPSVRTSPLEIFIYPLITAAMGLAFALTLRHGLDNLGEGSSPFRPYAVPAAISALSLIPVCLNISWVCGLYTSILSAIVNIEESVRAFSITLGLLNGNLIMWGIWSKAVEKQRIKKQI